MEPEGLGSSNSGAVEPKGRMRVEGVSAMGIELARIWAGASEEVGKCHASFLDRTCVAWQLGAVPELERVGCFDFQYDLVAPRKLDDGYADVILVLRKVGGTSAHLLTATQF